MTIKNGDLPAMALYDIPLDARSAAKWLDGSLLGFTKREAIAMHVMPVIYNLYSTDGTSVEFSEWRQGVVIESVRITDLLLDELERTK